MNTSIGGEIRKRRLVELAMQLPADEVEREIERLECLLKYFSRGAQEIKKGQH